MNTPEISAKPPLSEAELKALWLKKAKQLHRQALRYYQDPWALSEGGIQSLLCELEQQGLATECAFTELSGIDTEAWTAQINQLHRQTQRLMINASRQRIRCLEQGAALGV